MSIATFGNKIFSVSSNKVYTFDDFSLSGSLQVDIQEAHGKKPSTYIYGPGLDAISFKIPLDASLGVNVGQEIADWKTIYNNYVPQPFTIGGYPLTKNKWLLKSFTVSSPVFDNQGRWRKAILELSFEEYVRAGTKPKDKDSKGKKKKEKHGLEFYQARDQVKLKRNNPNTATASKSVNNSNTSSSQKMLDLFKSPFS